MLAIPGLCGPVTYVMCVIGGETMMEVMVSVFYDSFLLIVYLFSLLCFAVILSFIYICYCAVVLFCSREHENCGPQPGYVRAHIESKLFYASAF